MKYGTSNTHRGYAALALVLALLLISYVLTHDVLSNLQASAVPAQAEEAPEQTADVVTEPEERVPDIASVETDDASASRNSVTYSFGNLVGTPTDYSTLDNWLHVPVIEHAVDTIYLYPTCYVDASEGAPALCAVDYTGMRSGAARAYARQAAAFEESTNVFAPYYRQSNLAAIATLRGEALEAFQRQEQRSDVYAALDYYFDHFNGGRPFILAGHSQGSIMIKIALEDYFAAHPDYYARMIAAYIVGFSVTQADLDTYSHLKFAEGADDIGVIVSWNTEGPENATADNLVVEPGALAINPLNWRRDATPAGAEQNLGAWSLDAKTGTYGLVDGFADATLDVARGVVVCTTGGAYTTVDVPGVPQCFGPASYHSGEYPFYFANIRANIAARCSAWLAQEVQ